MTRLGFNISNEAYYLSMFEEVVILGLVLCHQQYINWELGYLRMRWLPSIRCEEHKKVWCIYSSFVISNSWTNEENITLINFLIRSLVGTLLLRYVDVSDAIKSGELLFTYLDVVVEKFEKKM